MAKRKPENVRLGEIAEEIIVQYEQGIISYDEAQEKLNAQIPGAALYFASLELRSAQILKED